MIGERRAGAAHAAGSVARDPGDPEAAAGGTRLGTVEAGSAAWRALRPLAVVTGAQMAEIDHRAQSEWALPGAILMENAGANAYAAVRAQNLRPGDDLALDVNGAAVPEDNVRRMWHEAGRSTNIGRPLPAYSTVIFDLDPDGMIDGDNTLAVTLTEQEEGASGDILIDEIDVTVMP